MSESKKYGGKMFLELKQGYMGKAFDKRGKYQKLHFIKSDEVLKNGIFFSKYPERQQR